MLEEIQSERNRRAVFRLSWVPLSDAQFLAEMNMDIGAREELMDLLSEEISPNRIESLLDGPFHPKVKLRNETRFSDGSFPVFYSALEAKTAEAEMAHHVRNSYAGEPQDKRTAYYRGFRCRFEGLEKDLRPKALDWPDLVHDSDYSFCNRLGAEAREWGIDGLVVPSARHDGANMPIFARQASSDPELEGVVAMTYSPDTGEVSITHLPEE